MKNKEYKMNNEELYDIVKERIIDVKPITFKDIDIIKDQNCYSVFKIVTDNKPCGTGFLCLIPFPNKLKPLPVLITCNHVLRDEDIKLGKVIKLIFNDKNEKTLYIDKTRRIYTSNDKKTDITMIEIKEDDGFNINKILEIDYDIYDEGELNKKYQNESLYVIHYPDGHNASFSPGIIQKIHSNNEIIEHLCSTKNGSSGAPIINLNTFKVIGIHTGKHRTSDFNLGMILRKPIDEFNANNRLKKEKSEISINSYETFSETDKSFRSARTVESNDNKKNEVNLKIKVKTKDIKQKVYFLDNTNFSDWFTHKKHFHDFLKELNESNTKVYINGNEMIYKKYFIPEEEGIYDIKIVINIKIKDCSFMFADCDNIISIDLSSFDASNATDISHMFYKNYQLESINFNNFNTKNVVNMSYMFVKCTKIEEIDISSFDINKIDLEKMKDLFLDCKNLQKVKVNRNSFEKINKKISSKVLKTKIKII